MRVVRVLRGPLAILLAALATPAIAGAKVDPLLAKQAAATPLGLGAVPVAITYDHPVSTADLFALRALGITGGLQLSPLPMVLARATAAQIAALRGKAGVRSLYANRRFPVLSNESRTFIGQRALRQDPAVTAALDGLPVSGKGIGIAYVDTGIDATHPDLALGKSVVQNVFFPLAEY